MATIPGLAGFAAGEAVTAAKLTQHTKTAIETAVYYKPFCHLYNSATQSLATGGGGANSAFNTVVEDSDSMNDVGNGRIKIVTAGLYRLIGQAAYASNATGFRCANIGVNGVIKLSALHQAANGAVTRVVATGVLRLAANDLITMQLLQTSGAALLTDTLGGGCLLQAEWVGL